MLSSHMILAHLHLNPDLVLRCIYAYPRSRNVNQEWPNISHCRSIVSTLSPQQNGNHFREDIYRFSLLNGNCWTERQHTIIWTNDDLVYWCIYLSLGLNELTPCPLGIGKNSEYIFHFLMKGNFYCDSLMTDAYIHHQGPDLQRNFHVKSMF